MHFTEIEAGHHATFELRVIPIGNTAFAPPKEGEEVELFRVGEEGAFVRRPHGDRHAVVEGDYSGAQRDLAALLDAGRPLICWVARVHPAKDKRPLRMIVEVRVMSQRIIAPAALPIHVDRLLIGQISRQERRDYSLAEAVEWLTDQFLLPSSAPDRTARAIMVPGRTEESTFLLRGREWSMRVRKRDSGWLADSLIRPRRDHRQLPHMLEPSIERELDQSLDEATREAMRRSLFQRLFDYAKTQEKNDGIKRWVTLNAQYRMHPVLGRFVSRVFYERHDASEKFDSPEDAASYRHPLNHPWTGKQAGWKQIPSHAGREERAGTSWRRPAEARWIAEEAHRILEAHRNVSLGVITFYRGQVDCILEEMHKIGLAEREEQTGGLRVARAWETTETDQGEPTERLRVGTVDAFQGKEFDIVILSMTRANDNGAATPAALRRKFGHLLLENRLCVAMSRQRHLLIVAGDSDTRRRRCGHSPLGLVCRTCQVENSTAEGAHHRHRLIAQNCVNSTEPVTKNFRLASNSPIQSSG